MGMCYYKNSLSVDLLGFDGEDVDLQDGLQFSKGVVDQVDDAAVTHGVDEHQQVELIKDNGLSVHLCYSVDGEKNPGQDNRSSVRLEVSICGVVEHESHHSLEEVGTKSESDQLGVVGNSDAVRSEDVGQPKCTCDGQEGNVSDKCI